MNHSSTSVQARSYRFSRHMWVWGSLTMFLLITPGLAISHPLFNIHWTSGSKSVPQTSSFNPATLSNNTYEVSPKMISHRYRDDAFYHLGHALARGFTYYFYPRHHHHEAHGHHHHDSYEHHYAPSPSYFYGPYFYGPSYRYPAYPYPRHYYGRHHHFRRHHHPHGHQHHRHH